jgi:hypothetical protein
MTVPKRKAAFPRHDGVRVMREPWTLRSHKGAGKAGYRLIPMAPVQQESTGKEPQAQPDSPAFPAQWCCGLYALSPVTGLVCHRHCAKLAPRNLASASGGQDHTTSPSAEALANDTRQTRYRSPLFLAKAASRARQALCPRPSHPASDVRDDRETPLVWRRDGATKSQTSEKRKQNIFRLGTGQQNRRTTALNRFEKFDFSRTRFCAACCRRERCEIAKTAPDGQINVSHA